MTLNLVPGKTVYGEKTVKIDVSSSAISAAYLASSAVTFSRVTCFTGCKRREG